MERCVILLSIPGLRHQDLPVMPRLAETLRHERAAHTEFSVCHLAGASEHADGSAAAGARCGGQRILLARIAAGRDVDGGESADRSASDLGPPA